MTTLSNDAREAYLARNRELVPELDALRELQPEMGNEFVTDVLRKAESRTLSPKQAAALSRCYYGYLKAQENAEKYADATHEGELNMPLFFTGTVTMVKEFVGRYGPSKLVKFDSEDGNILLTFSTARWTTLIEEGDTVEAEGIVKAHKEYRGTPETQLTRVKVNRTVTRGHATD